MSNRREFIQSIVTGAAVIVSGVNWVADKVITKTRGVIRSVKYGTEYSSIQEWEDSFDTQAEDDCEFEYIGETLGESIIILPERGHDGGCQPAMRCIIKLN